MGKLIDGGSVPKDSPLFSGRWFFTSQRLSDVPGKDRKEEPAPKPPRKRKEKGKSWPLDEGP